MSTLALVVMKWLIMFWLVLMTSHASTWGQTTEIPHVATHVVFLESARTLRANEFSLSETTRLQREVISLTRNEVVYRDFGMGLRTGFGIFENLEARADFHWITAAASGHSGQFDTQIGAKHGLATTGLLSTAMHAAVGGSKVMGTTPWYFATVRLPTTIDAKVAELSFAPRLTRGLDSASRFAATLEGTVEIEMTTWLRLFWEGFQNFRELNPNFRLFDQEKGFGYWTGLKLVPKPGIAIPILLITRAPNRPVIYGLAGVTFQLRLEL